MDSRRRVEERGSPGRPAHRPCPDCGAPWDGDRLHHEDDCPLGTALQAVAEEDLAWFATHADDLVRHRPVTSTEAALDRWLFGIDVDPEWIVEMQRIRHMDEWGAVRRYLSRESLDTGYRVPAGTIAFEATPASFGLLEHEHPRHPRGRTLATGGDDVEVRLFPLGDTDAAQIDPAGYGRYGIRVLLPGSVIPDEPRRGSPPHQADEAL